MNRIASAIWNGSIKDGRGTLTTGSGVLRNTRYSFTSRFENGTGTNPEELIGAAHAGCYTMALTSILGAAGYTPTEIETNATVTFEKKDAKLSVTQIHLDVAADVPNIDAKTFEASINEARDCPISRLMNAQITISSTLYDSERLDSTSYQSRGEMHL